MVKKTDKIRKLLLKTVLIILLCLLAWYFIGPLFGAAIVLGASAFAFLVFLLVGFIVLLLLIPILVGITSIIVFSILLILIIVGIIVFPVLLPFLIIIGIILLLIRLGSGGRDIR
jgi:hypothetical protein